MDDAPTRLQDGYDIWVKPNSKRFVKLNISGSPTLVIVPQWYIKNGNPPGTKYFNCVKAGTIHKFMEEDLNAERLPAGWEGAEHCAQEKPIGIYELKEITLQELNNLFPIGGKKGKSKTTKHRSKSRSRSKKHRRKSKKHKRKSRKHRRKNINN